MATAYKPGARSVRREMRKLNAMYNHKEVKGTHTYEECIFYEFKQWAKRHPDPRTATPAHLRLITKLCRYASFASFGAW